MIELALHYDVLSRGVDRVGKSSYRNGILEYHAGDSSEMQVSLKGIVTEITVRP